MELSHEDSLRLNVLVKQDLYAVRIDEASMTVHALTAKGEARVQLNPNCRDDAYLRRIRELLSTHALGSPGGYPVYLKRWTRMGQMREQSLDSLLILGEPEAVIAVAHAAGLTEEIARRAWWVMPTAEVARKMLECANVANSELGRELAHFLIEFLPFEAESFDVVHSVRLVLQPGLIDESIRLGLWKKAARKSAYYVGFLYADPKVLPRELGEHAELPQLLQQLKPLLEKGNSVVTQLVQVLSGSGQNYLQTIENALEKIADQDVMVALLNALQRYFHPTWPDDYTVPYH
ncbi:MAG: sulfur reduction protein DsrS, partial [Gammaproteobacteria bacterium]